MTGIKDGAAAGARAATISGPLLWRPGAVIVAAMCVLAFEYTVRLGTARMLNGVTDPTLWRGGWEISILITLSVLLAVFPPLARRKEAGLLGSFAVGPGSTNGALLAAAAPFAYLLPAAAAAILYFFPEARLAPGYFVDWHTPFASALILTGVVMGPIWEELFFRGYLFRALARSSIGPLAAAAFSSAAFAIHHFDKDIGGQFAMAAAGLVLCYVVYRSGTIVYGLIAHMVNNAILVGIDAARSLL